MPRLEEAQAEDPDHPEHRLHGYRLRRSVGAEEGRMLAEGTHPDLLPSRARRFRQRFGRGRPRGDQGDID
jgi:hypothetical protein